jgi:hypothetical protein
MEHPAPLSVVSLPAQLLYVTVIGDISAAAEDNNEEMHEGGLLTDSGEVP